MGLAYNTPITINFYKSEGKFLWHRNQRCIAFKTKSAL